MGGVVSRICILSNSCIKIIEHLDLPEISYETTIFENIRIGNAKTTVEEVIQADQMANFHEFIRALPDGYGTMLHEGGVVLSGGEKQ